MNDTKENILRVALKLFAKDGYEAVSVSMIAGELHMTKGALYKHYKNKQDIFDSIVKRMNELDEARAKEYAMPEGTMEKIAKGYDGISKEKVKTYAMAQFRHWTEEEFSSDFRKVLTLEQYRNAQMATMYQFYLVNGPLSYMKDLFGRMTGDSDKALSLALSFYSPIFILYSLYDGTENKEEVLTLLSDHIDRFIAEKQL